MKKKFKIALICGISACVVAGVTVGVVAALAQKNELFGTMYDQIHEGTGNYDWRKTETRITWSADEDDRDENQANARYYSNNPGDYIYNLFYSHYYSGKKKDTPQIQIVYNQYFNIRDDLDVFFVLKHEDSNGQVDDVYVTDTERSHSAWGTDWIMLSESAVREKELWNYYIGEVWVKTID